MAVTWGSVAKHMMAGLEAFVTPSTLTPSDMTATIGIDVWVTSVVWGFSDDQVATIGGDISNSISYHMTAPSSSTTAVYLGRLTLGGIPTSISGPVYRSFNLGISGIYAGAGSGADPYVAISVAIPARPPGVWVRVAGAWVAAVSTKVYMSGAWQPIVRWWGRISGTFR